MIAILPFNMKLLPLVALFSFSISSLSQSPGGLPDKATIFEHGKSATVLVLSGEGAGRLRSLATGVIISKDGIILTALHAIKGAAEVQVRTSNGEVFDRVTMLGFDERRDIAALKIGAGSLPALNMKSDASPAQGDAVYAVTNANGLAWSATEGIIAAVRPADEIPGTGNGYKLIQFTAPIAPGSSGGPLMDRAGALIGIITRMQGNAGLAVPIENISELPNAGMHIALGTGSALQLPEKTDAGPQTSAAVAGVDSKSLIKQAKTIYIHSKTSFLTVDTLDRSLLQQKEWSNLGLVLVQDPRVADLEMALDRPLFTYVFTFVITDKKTSIVLGSGKETAFDGTTASPLLAKQIVKFFASERIPKEGK